MPLWKIKDDHFCTETIHQISHVCRTWVKETEDIIFIFNYFLFIYFFFFLHKNKVFDHQDPSAGAWGLLHFPSLCPDLLKQESAVFKLFELIL